MTQQIEQCRVCRYQPKNKHDAIEHNETHDSIVDNIIDIGIASITMSSLLDSDTPLADNSDINSFDGGGGEAGGGGSSGEW